VFITENIRCQWWSKWMFYDTWVTRTFASYTSKSLWSVYLSLFICVLKRPRLCENIEIRLYIKFPAVMWSFCKKLYCHTRCDQQKFWNILLHYFGSNHFKASSSKIVWKILPKFLVLYLVQVIFPAVILKGRPHTVYDLNIMYHRTTATCSLRW
jgi:hypothetical protein